MKKKIWDSYKEVAVIQRTEAIQVHIALAAKDGAMYVNLREFYLRKRDGEWRPGFNGMSFPVLMPIKQGTEFLTPCACMIEGLQAALTASLTFPIYDEATAVYIEEVKK